MELAFRESLKKMRGTKSKEKFSQELEMSRSNYSLIESGKSDPTLKTLERIAELTNSTLVIDLNIVYLYEAVFCTERLVVNKLMINLWKS